VITATIVGNVGKKPEVKTTGSGKLMCRFGVASTKKVEGKEPVTSWVNVLAFAEQAEQVGDRINQGDRVVVTGRLEVEKYTNKDGVEQTSVTLLADEVGISLRFPPKGQQRKVAAEEETWSSPF
jgi:single-strand DNA-binding protein